MTELNRLPSSFGSLIDHKQPVRFQFEGRYYSGFHGDTIASALAANNQWILSRSFKYHRARGILTMAGQDANTLVQLPNDPNVPADVAPIVDGLIVRGQNYSGSLQHDRNASIQYLSRFLPVGFYYKAFFRPRGIWEYWAKFFRKKTGLGVINERYVASGYDKQYKFCDVLVIGAGAAGMTAAITAANAGAEVLLVDEQVTLGGALNYARMSADLSDNGALRESLVAQVSSHTNIELMTKATANGWFGDNWVPVIQGKRMFKVRAAEVIMCTGALEQLSVFRNNDVPGVMLAGAASRLIRLYGVRPGEHAVVLTANDAGYACALDLVDAGVDVRAIVDLRADSAPTSMSAADAISAIPVYKNSAVYAASESKNHLRGVEIRDIVASGECADDGRLIDCDLLCMSVGFMPTYQLACQAGATLGYDNESARFSIENLPSSVQMGGAANGFWNMDAAIDDAQRAAITATNALALTTSPLPSFNQEQVQVNHDWPMFAHPKGKEFVDLDEDLQLADIVNATLDGYEHIQLVKRFSTCGMGPSQGRHSALPAARLVARATGKTIAETGVTTARPPFSAESLAHCAGLSFYPARRSNMHHRHLDAGAEMLQIGNWYRPAYYRSSNDAAATIEEEAHQVRNGVGIIDVSTLGGIDVRGPDAAEFLNRMYTFVFAKQPVGRARYALMTNEAGVVIDDGVACRLDENMFYVTATTGGVDRVFQSMLKWNAQWRMDVDIANVTSAYCAVNIAGPQSRQVLQRICTDLDLSSDGFPYMGVRTGRVADIPARLLRVGFVGELGFEIHAPQHCGEALWDALIEAGKDEGIRPFGIDAQRLLRLEKGHIIIGQDTDAMSSPAEVGMKWAVGSKKPFFVGQRTIRELDQMPAKRALVGFEITDLEAPVPKESHLVVAGDQMLGRVTSAAYSPSLQKTIGLAYVAANNAESGATIQIRTDKQKLVNATVVPIPFYDRDNSRQEL